MATYEFKLPDIGEGVVEGEIVRWLVKEGDHLRVDQPMVEVMTDKATVEIPSPRAGRVIERVYAEGQICPVGKVLVRIDEGATASDSPAPAADRRPDVVVAIESRGFIFGAALAVRLGVGFIPVRKPGKLPWTTVRRAYALEYGTDALEMHTDALGRSRAAILVDDLRATGGTAAAAVHLVEEQGARVAGCLFVIELLALGGRQKLASYGVDALIAY